MNSYDLSRNFWNWAFDNPEKISPNHAAVYFFAIEHCNRLGWKKKFGFPSQMTMDAIGIKKHSTYIRYFNDLVEFGFFELIQKSMNQYSSNIISLTNALPKKGVAMDKAIVKHREKQKEYKQTNKQLNNITERKQSFRKSIASFNKANPDKYPKQLYVDFESYWSEHGENDVKMRFEKQTSFSINRRLATWFKNDFNDAYKPKKKKVVIDPNEYLNR